MFWEIILEDMRLLGLLKGGKLIGIFMELNHSNFSITKCTYMIILHAH